MRIDDAVKKARSAAKKLSGTDKVAVLCLIKVAQSVIRARKPIKDLSASLDTDLNQESMFG